MRPPTLRRVHRYLGLVAALWVLLLSGTGLLLNHSPALRLDARDVQTPWLLDWYGIAAPPLTAYALPGAPPRWLSHAGDRLYLDAHELPGRYPGLGGALALEAGGLLVALSGAELLLLDADGGLVERLNPAQGLPTGGEALGLDSDGHALLRTPAGVFRADPEWLDWERLPAPPAGAVWATPGTPPGALSTLTARARGGLLNWERVLLDLHSGRLLGAWGVYLMDAAALVLMLLALSGVWMAWRGRRRFS